MKSTATYTSAATLLSELLQKYGRSVCDTPQMFETLLRKHGRGCPQEVDVLAAALRHGVVNDLRGKSPREAEALARVLAVSAHIQPYQAEWAVESWAAALAAAPQAVATAKRDDVESRKSGTPLRAALVLAGAAITGSLAYLIWSP